ncbi:hypothetical protein H4V97_001370 [Flavobacterium sp. CG_23.5]|uniref:hypothetical protein n=1 Tax=Flavobacterium sp. CG_23.5 TaxID=2760708 RepID=UPI001AEA9BB5|nr:hypothetical protein [Flavobacterium sp. CG_23.5]MBP2283052.1 hypothetical protein [Flavobacterium sp. CG_23.5]
MIWKKRGKIIDPTQIHLGNGCTEFAQSPQTIVFDDFVRIYFSTRKRDAKGAYLSLISYIDMDLNLEKIILFSENEVIGLGELGTFDEHGIFPINPFKEDDKIYAFTCGWNRRISVPVETSIGITQSNDNGKTFQRLGNGPILSSSLKEPVLVGDGFVQKYNEMYHMWYIFGTKWIPKTESEPVARVYKIGHAISKDLLNWQKEEGKQIIADVLNQNECQALPTVIKIGNTYHMYFCFREATDFRDNSKRSYKLGYAYSSDLIHWTRNDSLSGITISENPKEWDSEMMCYPHVFSVKDKVFLLYNGNDFGKYGFGFAELINDENE